MDRDCGKGPRLGGRGLAGEGGRVGDDGDDGDDDLTIDGRVGADWRQVPGVCGLPGSCCCCMMICRVGRLGLGEATVWRPRAPTHTDSWKAQEGCGEREAVYLPCTPCTPDPARLHQPGVAWGGLGWHRVAIDFAPSATLGSLGCPRQVPRRYLTPQPPPSFKPQCFFSSPSRASVLGARVGSRQAGCGRQSALRVCVCACVPVCLCELAGWEAGRTRGRALVLGHERQRHTHTHGGRGRQVQVLGQVHGPKRVKRPPHEYLSNMHYYVHHGMHPGTMDHGPSAHPKPPRPCQEGRREGEPGNLWGTPTGCALALASRTNGLTCHLLASSQPASQPALCPQTLWCAHQWSPAPPPHACRA